MNRPTIGNSIAVNRFSLNGSNGYAPVYLDGTRGPVYPTRQEAEADFVARTISPTTKARYPWTYANDRLFDTGYQVGMHAALFDQGIIDQREYHDEIGREHTIYHNDPPDSWDAYWLGRQVGYDMGYQPAIVACFPPSSAPTVDQVAARYGNYQTTTSALQSEQIAS